MSSNLPLNASEIGLVINELAPRWAGAQIQRVAMRGPALLLLTLRIPGESGVLRLSVEHDLAHLCLATERGEVEPAANAFCMLLRKHIKGTRLESLRQLGADRVVELRCSRATLVAEMLGRRGTFLLCNPEQQVLGSSRPSAGRPQLARPGERYEPPAPPVNGESTGTARAARCVAGAANGAVLEWYASSRDRSEASTDRAAIARVLSAHIKRQRRLVGKVEGDRARAEGRLELSRHGELLKLALRDVRKGMESIDVEDVLYGSGEVVTITLDPALTPAENLDRLFKQARKARRAVEVAGERLTEAEDRLLELEIHREGLAAAGAEKLEELAEALGLSRASGQQPRRNARAPRRVPYREYRDARDRRVLVGKSAADNDKLTLQVARPDDLWLHARGYRGSHVVMPLDRGEEVDSERLLDAATLAAHFSEARENTTVEVTYTRRKYVQKGRGLPPGKVTLLREKTLLLSVEPARLERLKDAQIHS